MRNGERQQPACTGQAASRGIVRLIAVRVSGAGSVVGEEEILAFARDAIRSVWTLELLLLLRRDPDKAWSLDELVASLHANTRIVQEGVATLDAAGLIAIPEDNRYQFAAASPVVAEIARQLVDLHGLKPVAVVKAILSAPNDKIRTFADAFRFKK